MAQGTLIITGVSSGIGLALAKEAMEQGWHVQGVSRTEPPKEILSNTLFTFIKGDLTRPEFIETFPLHEAKEGLTVLVNNAGTIGPIGAVSEGVDRNINETMAINVVAPMRLTARFVTNVKGPRAVYFTGSGAASYPIEGWSTYCASKAAIHQFAEVLAKENPEIPVHAFKPGKVDTPMQQVIRNAAGGGFPDQDLFIREFEEGLLVKPEEVAQKLMDIITNPRALPVVFSLSDIEL